ncbi:MAG: ATP-binding protein, partial [Bacillota bacterium]
TRIQLLMAVRMAFIEQEENELALPLFLDETLANSDEQRARAIIESVIELARRGRQCFYFTAQLDEVQKWLSILEDESDLEAKVINLGKNQDKSRSVFTIDPVDIPELDIVPSTVACTHEEYQDKIDVPNFNPRKGAGEIHLWYLVDDLELLEVLLKKGVSKWGQLKTLLQIGRLDFIPEDKSGILTEISMLGESLEEFVRSWKVGRGKPVDRNALVRSDAVSSTFIDEVTELAREVGGDAEILISKLREGAVANFRSNKTDQLEQYFREEKYIDNQDILSEEDIYLRMISRISGDSELSGQKVVELLKRIAY